MARKPRLLDDRQFDDLTERFIAAAGGGDEAIRILAEGIRFKQEQRLKLRAKVFQEASIELVIRNAAPLRISDLDVAELAGRMRAAFAANPGAALLALETFGERLLPETQRDAVSAIAGAKASYALAALRHLNFSPALRATLFSKTLADASHDDFDAARLARDKLEDALTPAEMRALIAHVIRKSEASAKWLAFAVRALPLRQLTIAERRSVLNGLLFESAKSAFEFVSEHRHYFEATDVNEVTYDYTKTIANDMCLHLSHRNKKLAESTISARPNSVYLGDCARSK